VHSFPNASHTSILHDFSRFGKRKERCSGRFASIVSPCECWNSIAVYPIGGRQREYQACHEIITEIENVEGKLQPLSRSMCRRVLFARGHSRLARSVQPSIRSVICDSSRSCNPRRPRNLDSFSPVGNGVRQHAICQVTTVKDLHTSSSALAGPLPAKMPALPGRVTPGWRSQRTAESGRNRGSLNCRRVCVSLDSSSRKWPGPRGRQRRFTQDASVWTV